jgi:hypothetical protein
MPKGQTARGHDHIKSIFTSNAFTWTNWKRGITLMIIEKSSYSARQSEKSFPHKSKKKLQI